MVCAKVRLSRFGKRIQFSQQEKLLERRGIKWNKYQKNKVSIKAKVQRIGSTLSSMVMPNIGALIAWGVLTALFIPDGYLPNKPLPRWLAQC